MTAAIPFSGMAYKPLQSLFNKMYVRRGQMAMSLIGDLQRGTTYVNTPEELEQVKQPNLTLTRARTRTRTRTRNPNPNPNPNPNQVKKALSQQYRGNLDRRIDRIGNLALMLAEIRACTPMN